jgi:hypothetical protein
MRAFVLWLASAMVACGSAGDDVGTASQALSSGLVISQIYGAGGNAAATYGSDFVELFNRGTSPISLSGMSVQYASAAGTTWQAIALPSKSVPPGGYFLISLASGAAGAGAALPSPDATGTINMGANNGRVALVDGAAALSCGASCQSNPGVVDFVGFGTATDHEGSAAAPAPADTTHSMQRKLGGCTETDDNGSDFEAIAVAPRSSASAPAPCGAVVDASTEDTASDASSEDSATEPDSLAREDSSTVTDTAVDSGTKKNGGPSDLPTASTCAVSIHNPSHRSDALALFAVALAFALSRRALR